jgi:hypothetical protein
MTAPTIELIKERRQEIQLEIRRLTNLVIGLDMALEILDGKPPEVGAEVSSASASSVNNKPAAPPRKRKTADERKEEIAALLEQGKTEDEIMTATGLGRASIKMYFSILKARTKELPGRKAVPVEKAAPTTASPPKKRRGRPPKKSAPAEEGEYPIIGRTIGGEPQFGSMRMKVIEEKVVDGHKVKVLPPGYAQGAYPQRNVTLRS